MNKFILILIPLLTLALFIFIMNSGFLFKAPGDYDVGESIESMKNSVISGDWETAGSSAEQMKQVITDKIFPYVQYSVERDEMLDVKLSIAKIEGCIVSKDKSLTLLYLAELKNHWENLGE